MKEKTREELLAEVNELKIRIMECEETLNAIQNGEVDALVVSSPEGDQIYSLEGADKAYRTLIEEMNEGAAILMQDGTIFYCNSPLANMVKVPLKEIMGTSMLNLILKEDRWMYEALLKKSLVSSSSSSSSREIRLKAADGTHFPAFLSVKKIKLDNLDVISVNITDLSEQKRNEEIIASERLSRCIFEQAGESIIVCDDKGYITRASDISHQLCNCNPNLEHFNDIFKLYNENDDIFTINTVLGGKSIYNMEFFLEIDKDNKLILIANARPITSKNNIIGCVITLTDITDRKKAEEELKESYCAAEADRNRLETLINTIPSAVVILEQPDGEISFINEHAKELYGMDPTGLKMEKHPKIGLLKLDGTPYPPEEMPASRSLLKGEVVHNEDLILKKPNGKRIFVSASSAPIYNSKGEIDAVIGVFNEITERKQLEEELRQARDLLEEKVEERTAEIEEAYQYLKENQIKLKEAINELERSNRELQSFAYITSHDLQEPLRNIASFAQLLQRRYKGQLDSDADDFIEFMVDGSKRMKEMIQGLLDYSGVDKNEIKPLKTDMNTNLEKAMFNLKLSIDESKAEITHDSLPTIFAESDQMVRVFQNLIANAIKFKKPQFPPRIHIAVDKNLKNNEYVFSVADNGIGIENQYTDRIFEVFKRLHTINEYRGAGVGLAIVKRIIERHGGRIWVDSDLDMGSTFYFTLPKT